MNSLNYQTLLEYMKCGLLISIFKVVKLKVILENYKTLLKYMTPTSK